MPADVRKRAGLREGTTLVLLPTAEGMVLMTREQLRTRVVENLAGLDLVGELLADRRKSAAREDGLALAERLDTPVLTADTAWEAAGRIRQIR